MRSAYRIPIWKFVIRLYASLVEFTVAYVMPHQHKRLHTNAPSNAHTHAHKHRGNLICCCMRPASLAQVSTCFSNCRKSQAKPTTHIHTHNVGKTKGNGSDCSPAPEQPDSRPTQVPPIALTITATQSERERLRAGEVERHKRLLRCGTQCCF